MVSERLISIDCYNKVKQPYIDNGFLLWPWPCIFIEGADIGHGIKLKDIAFRDMDVRTPPEVDHLWEYPEFW